jgi:nucleoside-diphosphate-sugar epimerase
MNILITGGLGYIGTELCEIYSGESRFKNITVLDKRFISERVKELRNWGIDFIQGDILDKDLVTDLVKKSDIVIHLAGITDVAYVKSDKNIDDEEIRRVGELGTQNILNALPSKSKIIFPSTHVVFEGFKEIKKELLEIEDTSPILTYAVNK